MREDTSSKLSTLQHSIIIRNKIQFPFHCSKRLLNCSPKDFSRKDLKPSIFRKPEQQLQSFQAQPIGHLLSIALPNCQTQLEKRRSGSQKEMQRLQQQEVQQHLQSHSWIPTRLGQSLQRWCIAELSHSICSPRISLRSS